MRLADIIHFLQSPLGAEVVQCVQRTVCPLLGNTSHIPARKILGIGYTSPYIQGVEYQHILPPLYYDTFHCLENGRTPHTVVADEDHMPFANDTVDLAVVIHALEHAHSPWGMMTELQRLMVSGGRVIVVVPNRVSLWSRVHKTPFASGMPYTKKQLAYIMQSVGFMPVKQYYGVLFPPWYMPLQPRVARVCTTVGRYVWPENGGVIIGVYEKHVLNPVKSDTRVRIMSPIMPEIIGMPKDVNPL